MKDINEQVKDILTMLDGESYEHIVIVLNSALEDARMYCKLVKPWQTQIQKEGKI